MEGIPYKIKIPGNVKKELKEQLGGDADLLRMLGDRLEALRTDPYKAGEPIREDLPGGHYIELGDFRAYYYIRDETKEVRFFHFERYWHHW